MLFDRVVKSVEPEVGFLVFGVGAVALEAFVREYRSDLSVKIDLRPNKIPAK